MRDILYNTASDYARESGYHQSTISKWIKAGKIKAYKPKKSKFWRVASSEFVKVKPKRGKSGKNWSKTEEYILRNNLHLTNEVLAKMLRRTLASVKCKKRRLRLVKIE